jgi:hypothetical protein
MKNPGRPDPNKKPRQRDPLRRAMDEHALEHQRRHQAQAKAIMEQAVENAQRMLTEGFSREMALAELEAARLAALASFPVQAGAAVQATFIKAKIMGLIIEKAAVLHGDASSPGLLQGDAIENQREVISKLRERVGSNAAHEFLGIMVDMKLLSKQSAQELEEGDDERGEGRIEG